jgi:hypothetical protein
MRFNTPELKFYEHAAIIAAASTRELDAAVMASGPTTRKAQVPDAVAK